MAEPVDVEFDATVQQLFRLLRGSLRDLCGGIFHGDHQVTTRMVESDRTFKGSSHLGLVDMKVVHRFLSDNVIPPTAGFRSPYVVLGSRFWRMQEALRYPLLLRLLFVIGAPIDGCVDHRNSYLDEFILVRFERLSSCFPLSGCPY